MGFKSFWVGWCFFCLLVWFFFLVVFSFFLIGQKKNLFALTLLFVFLLCELGSLRCGVYGGFTPEALNFVGGSRRRGLMDVLLYASGNWTDRCSGVRLSHVVTFTAGKRHAVKTQSRYFFKKISLMPLGV